MDSKKVIVTIVILVALGLLAFVLLSDTGTLPTPGSDNDNNGGTTSSVESSAESSDGDTAGTVGGNVGGTVGGSDAE